MRRAIQISSAVACGFLFTPVALASPLAGARETCPGKYEPMTRSAIHAQAESLGIPQERADAAFDAVNRNADPWICQKGTPPSEPGFNWTDNQAIGLGR